MVLVDLLWVYTKEDAIKIDMVVWNSKKNYFVCVGLTTLNLNNKEIVFNVLIIND